MSRELHARGYSRHLSRYPLVVGSVLLSGALALLVLTWPSEAPKVQTESDATPRMSRSWALKWVDFAMTTSTREHRTTALTKIGMFADNGWLDLSDDLVALISDGLVSPYPNLRFSAVGAARGFGEDGIVFERMLVTCAEADPIEAIRDRATRVLRVVRGIETALEQDLNAQRLSDVRVMRTRRDVESLMSEGEWSDVLLGMSGLSLTSGTLRATSMHQERRALLEVLLECLERGPDVVQAEALRLAGELGELDPKIEGVACHLAESGVDSVRANALFALSSAACVDDHLGLFGEALLDGDFVVRANAAKALGDVTAPKARAVASELLRKSSRVETNRIVRASMEGAIHRLERGASERRR